MAGRGTILVASSAGTSRPPRSPALWTCWRRKGERGVRGLDPMVAVARPRRGSLSEADMGRYLDLIAAAEAASSPQTGNGINGINRDAGIIPFIPYPVGSFAPPRLLGTRDDYHAVLRGLDARCPDRVEDHGRWRQAVADGELFLARWGEQARSLGWASNDLFGFHPVAPLERYDAMGLCWLLCGQEVLRLTATFATIAAAFREPLTYYRRSRIG